MAAAAVNPIVKQNVLKAFSASQPKSIPSPQAGQELLRKFAQLNAKYDRLREESNENQLQMKPLIDERERRRFFGANAAKEQDNVDVTFCEWCQSRAGVAVLKRF